MNDILEKQRWALWVLMFFSIITLYYGVISPPPLRYITTDENFISETGVFMLYGNPLRAPEWPAALSLWIAFLLIICQCIATIVRHVSSNYSSHDFMVDIDQTAYHYLTHRTDFILYERLIQLGLVIFIYFHIFKLIQRSTQEILSLDAKKIVAVILVCSAPIWIFTSAVRPDALAVVLFILLVSKLLFSENLKRIDCLVIVLLFSLTLSQRLLFLLMTPFVFGSLIYIIRRQKFGLYFFFTCLLTTFFSFVAFLPYVITNSILVIKGFAGTIMVKSSGHNKYYFNAEIIQKTLNNPYSWFYILFIILGIFYLLKHYRPRIFIYLFVLNFCLAAFIILRASTVTESHTIVLSAMATFFAAFGIISVSKMPIFKQKLGTEQSIGWTILVICFLATTFELYKFHKEIRATSNLESAVNWLKTLDNDTKISMDCYEFETYVRKNDACLIREMKQIGDVTFQNRKMEFMLHWHEGTKIPYVISANNFEDEKLLFSENSILLLYSKPEAHKLDAYFHDVRPYIYGYAEEINQAIENFKQGKFEYIILKQALPNSIPFKVFNKNAGEYYYIYKNLAPKIIFNSLIIK